MILVIPKELLPDPLFQGFKEVDNVIYKALHGNPVWLERDLAEQDPNYKQVIPYVFVVKPGEPPKVLTYLRDGGGERRLDQKRSIGFGGHIEKIDGEVWNPLEAGLMRELSEELGEDSIQHLQLDLVGYINDDSNPVGQVHLGVVYIGVSDEELTSSENELKDFEYLTLEELQGRIDEFETWSQILIKNLKPRFKGMLL